jgi:hypothetical protein
MKRTSDIPRASKEVVLEAAKLHDAEARALVTNYYEAQKKRQATDMQIRHIGDRALSPALTYTADSYAIVEQQNARFLQKYAEASPVGRWCLAQHGIGPVIAAGCLAHIDITKAPTAGHIFSFFGLNPTVKWKKGEKRPWNADGKQIAWHAGECFKRASNHPDCYYGAIYRIHKQLLIERNENGFNTERAKTFFTRSDEVKKILATGKLPPGNLDSQACRYAAKMFLSHLHGVMFWCHYGKVPPKPYAISILGHAHEIKIPHLNMLPGLEAAYYGGVALSEAAE